MYRISKPKRSVSIHKLNSQFDLFTLKDFIRLLVLQMVLFNNIAYGYPQSIYEPESDGFSIQFRKESPSDENPDVINGVAVPVDFPGINIPINGNTSPGKIFLCNRTIHSYIMILENDGTPFFYKRLKNITQDFRIQPGGTLTRWNGGDLNYFAVMDSTYQEIDTLRCKGYDTDSHEIQLLSNGHYFLIALEHRNVDMSEIIQGGDSSATVRGCNVHEYDENHNLIFEWSSWDHYNIVDAIHEDLSQHFIDYVHMNAIAIDYDGHILISSRNLDEVTKINRKTGEIIWRLGGVNNQFQFVNDEFGISYQHDIRPVPGVPNNYTIYDNGTFHTPKFSRAVEFHLDTIDMIAAKVWEYRHMPDRYSSRMGNVQRLPNGNTLINWAVGALPKATEVTPDGEIVYELFFNEPSDSYRTYRFDWSAAASVPYLIAERYPEKTRLIFNQFGDTAVSYYKIYQGSDPAKLEVIDSTENTWIEAHGLKDSTWAYFGVSAVHNDGSESEISNIDSVFNYHVNPGANLLYNGHFGLEKEMWELSLSRSAVASDTVKNGYYSVKIESTGERPGDIALLQNNIPLIEGKRYALEFDASMDTTGSIEIKLSHPSELSRPYSRIGYVNLELTQKHYTYYFTMDAPTDLNTTLYFNLGTTAGIIHFDNISIKEVLEPINANLTKISNISCQGSADGLISVSATGGAGPYSFILWPDSVHNTSGTFQIFQEGNYSVEISDNSVLGPVRIDNIQIIEPDSVSLDSMNVLNPSSVDSYDGRITIVSGGGSGTHTYLLLPDSTLNTNGVFTELDNGEYRVVISDENNCGTVVSEPITLSHTSSADREITSSGLIQLYPNPANNRLTIKSNQPGELFIEIISLHGQQVYIDRLELPTHNIDLSRFREGIYIIKIKSPDSVWTDLVIKQ